MMLLSDQVFSQAPKAMKRLVAFVADEPGFQRLTSATTPQGRRDMGLPASAGAKTLFEACLSKLEGEDDATRRRTLREVMAQNADQETLRMLWTTRFRDSLMKCSPLREAMDFGIVSSFTPPEIEKLADGDVKVRLRWLMLANYHEVVTKDLDLHNAAIGAFFDGSLHFQRDYYSEDPITALEGLLNSSCRTTSLHYAPRAAIPKDGAGTLRQGGNKMGEA